MSRRLGSADLLDIKKLLARHSKHLQCFSILGRIPRIFPNPKKSSALERSVYYSYQPGSCGTRQKVSKSPRNVSRCFSEALVLVERFTSGWFFRVWIQLWGPRASLFYIDKGPPNHSLKSQMICMKKSLQDFFGWKIFKHIAFFLGDNIRIFADILRFYQQPRSSLKKDVN